MRDYNLEAQEQKDKKYNYDFDGIVRQYMMRDFAKFFRDGPALELGCYHGDSTVELVKCFSDLTVIEASDEAIGVARKRVPPSVVFISSTIESLVLSQRFDSVFLINTLEHLDETAVVLSKAREWLTDEGRLYVLVPNADAPSRQIAVYMGLIESNNAVTKAEWEHGHRRTYSFDTLEADMRRSDLKVVARGGLLFKALANFQFDRTLASGVITDQYIEGCYKLGAIYPSLCASIYVVCSK